jgi:peptide/nickel transport system substrate-binding protein
MKRILPLILCLSLILCLLAGCASENTPYIPTGDALMPEDADLTATAPKEDNIPQELTLAYYADRELNPFRATDFTNRVLFSLIYQGLFTYNSNYEPVPLLCSAYRANSDNRTYTFFVDPNATFSDGTPVTNEDVLASYEAALNSKYYGGRFVHVAEVKQTEDGGIAFYLRLSVEDFPILLDFPIVKASQVEADKPLGTGPYILENSLAGAQLRRNTAWWCQSPDLLVTASSISLVAAESTTHIRDEFEFSDVGLVLTEPCSDIYADYRCDYELWDCDNGTMMYLACNVGYSQDDIFSADTLRKGLTFAIDRDKIVAEYFNGFGRAATLAMDPGYPYYSDSLAMKYEYNPEKYAQAVSQTKRPKEPLELLVNADDSLRLRVAKDIVEMLTAGGLDVVLVEANNSQYIAKVKAANYDLYLGVTRLSPNMDLSSFFRTWGNLSWGAMADEELYELCKDALENHGNFYNLHKAVADDGSIVPIAFYNNAIYATRGLLSDLQPVRDNVFFYTLGKTDADVFVPIDYHNSNG